MTTITSGSRIGFRDIELLQKKLDVIKVMLQSIEAPTIRSTISANIGEGSKMLGEHAIMFLELDMNPDEMTTRLYLHPSGSITEITVIGDGAAGMPVHFNPLLPTSYSTTINIEMGYIVTLLTRFHDASSDVGSPYAAKPVIQVALDGTDDAIAELTKLA